MRVSFFLIVEKGIGKLRANKVYNQSGTPAKEEGVKTYEPND